MMKKSLILTVVAILYSQFVLASNDTAPSASLNASSMNAGSVSVTPTGELPTWITSLYPPYSSVNKVDPFVSFVKVREYETMMAAKQAKLERKKTTPLETVDVHSLKLIGIIEKPGQGSTAMVVLPDGKGYFLRKGMTVGLYDGVVTSIGEGLLTVDEQFTDVFNEAKTRTITLRLRQEKE